MAALELYGVIGDPGVTATDVAAQLAAAGTAAVTVRINSPGGLVDEGLAIHARLAAHPGRKVVHVDGLAASMASVIAMAGDEIVFASGALMMVHDPRLTFTGGTADELRRDAMRLDKMADALVGIYARRTGQPAERIAEMMAAETWLNASEAVELGFADRIEGAANRGKLAAALSALPSCINLPAAIAALMENSMSVQTAADPSAEANAAPGGSVTAAAGGTVAAERRRAAALLGLARKAKLDSAIAEDWIAKGLSVDQARAQAIDLWAAQDVQDEIQTTRVARVTAGVSYDAPDAVRDRVVTALAHRLGLPGKVPDDARQYRGLPIEALAAAVDDASGSAQPWRRREFWPGAQAIHTTSDLPNLLLNEAGQRVLQDSFQRLGSPLKNLARVIYVQDFRAIVRARRGEAPKLLEISESSEVLSGTVGEEAETYRVKSYARNFKVSRTALINDDLNGFGDFLQDLGRSAAVTEAELLVSLLTGNGPTLADGKSLWHADHGNLVSTGAAPPNVAQLDKMKAALRLQRGVSGDVLGLPLIHVVVPAALEGTAMAVAAMINPAAVANVNVHAGVIQPHVEPRLDATSAAIWYGATDPAILPWLEIAYLDGSRRGATNGAPLLEEIEDKGNLGTTFQAVFDVGAWPINFRAAVKNVGA